MIIYNYFNTELTDIFPSTPVLKNNTQIVKASLAVLYSNLNTTLRKFNRSYCLQTVHKLILMYGRWCAVHCLYCS